MCVRVHGAAVTHRPISSGALVSWLALEKDDGRTHQLSLLAATQVGVPWKLCKAISLGWEEAAEPATGDE